MRQGPLRIDVHASRRLAIALAGMHALAIAACWSVDGLPAGLRGAATIVLLASGVVHHRRTLAHAGLSALELREDCAGSVCIGGEWRDAIIEPGAVALPGLIVLPLAVDGGRPRRLVLLSDSAGAESLRRLRVLLRWRCGTRQPENRTAAAGPPSPSRTGVDLNT